MKYCLVKQETHHDSFVDDIVYGPFDDFSEAQFWQNKMENMPDNYNEGHQLYRFLIREIEMPV